MRLPGDTRQPVRWCTYPGDARDVLDPTNNPRMVGTTREQRALAHTGRQDSSHQWLFPVEVHYDPAAGTSRVGWSYAMPSRKLEDAHAPAAAV